MNLISNATETNSVYAYRPEAIGKYDADKKAELFKEKTGFEFDPSAPHRMSAESKVRLGYHGEFFRVYLNYGSSERMEKTAEKYAELREEILAKHENDEDRMYKELGELNESFETWLRNTTVFVPSILTVPRKPHEFVVIHNEEERLQFEEERLRLENEALKEEVYRLNLKDFLSGVADNMNGHLDTFFERFIKSIETNDFETAFSESMALMNDSETKSAANISYQDALDIVDILTNKAVDPNDLDEYGRPKEYRYNTSDDALRALVRDREIPYAVRKDVAERFGFYIEDEVLPENAGEAQTAGETARD